MISSKPIDFDLFYAGCVQGLSSTGLPPTAQSLSRQRTTSSSSSTHSQHTVGSQRRGSSPLSTPGVTQASNRPLALLRRNVRHASLTGGRVDVSACGTDSIFQFGLPLPSSAAYTVCFLH